MRKIGKKNRLDTESLAKILSSPKALASYWILSYSL